MEWCFASFFFNAPCSKYSINCVEKTKGNNLNNINTTAMFLCYSPFLTDDDVSSAKQTIGPPSLLTICYLSFDIKKITKEWILWNLPMPTLNRKIYFTA